jgi:hypothetical protein
VSPLGKGFALALISVLAASIGVALALSTAPPADPSLLQGIALVGASLVLAYIVEVFWLLSRMSAGDDREWFGFLVGSGATGFLGVVIALVLAQHRSHGYDNFLDDLGLAWSAVSLLILGGTLVLQPLLAVRGTGARPR